MSRRIALLIGGALALGLHVSHSYWPRARVLAPARASLPNQVSSAGCFVWLPFPHQNLAVLEGRVGPIRPLVADLAVLLGRDRPRFPRLGPWLVPPARELIVAGNGEGALSVGVALYRPLRWLARSAGILAGNPWLKGGEIATGGREVHVRWREGVWWLDGDAGSRVDSSALTRPVHGLVGVPAPGLGPLRPGRYLLDVGEQSARLESASSAAAGPARPGVGEGLVLGLWERGGAGLLLFDRPGVIDQVPAFAYRTPDAGSDWIPGLSDALEELPSEREGGSFQASDDRARREAKEYLAGWKSSEELRVLIWIDARGSRERIAPLVDLALDFPLLSLQERRRLEALDRLLDRLPKRGHLWLVMGERGSAELGWD